MGMSDGAEKKHVHHNDTPTRNNYVSESGSGGKKHAVDHSSADCQLDSEDTCSSGGGQIQAEEEVENGEQVRANGISGRDGDDADSETDSGVGNRLPDGELLCF